MAAAIVGVLAVSALIATGQLLLKVSLASVHTPLTSGAAIRVLVSDWRFWVACSSTGAGAVLWMTVLTTTSLSWAYPIMVGLSLLLVMLASSILLGERLSPASWVGTFLIIGGIYLLSRGIHR